VIGRLTGVAIERGFDGCCVLDVKGVGYEVFVPLRELGRLAQPPAEVTLLVHTHVREDTLRLYGFADAEDREAFRAMLAVSGVGPKLAMAILSELSAGELASAIARADKKRLSSVSGIGKKMADRLVLELKDKLPETPGGAALPAGKLAGLPPGRAGEVVSALQALGFSRGQAEAAADKVVAEEDARPIETLIRQALSTLAS
jgi:holliday junction DNA helicase RuvA